MPQLVGEKLDVAQKLLDNLDVKVTISTIFEHDDDTEEGVILATDPVSGTSLQAGQLVTLTVSQGQEEEPAIVPALVGTDVDEALLAIEEANLEPGRD